MAVEQREQRVGKQKPVMQSEVRTEVVTVTPELAEEWLQFSVENQRKLKSGRLQAYRRDMEAGRWRLTGQGLLWNAKGELIDGQHRLAACIMAGVPFITLVVHGLPDDVMQSVDRGLPRSLVDYLRWQSERETTILASVIRMSWFWMNGHLRNHEWSFNGPTIEESILWLKKNPTLRQSAAPAIRLRRGPLYLAASVGGAFWWRAHSLFPDETDRFIDQLIGGSNLEEGSPVLAYRRYLARMHDLGGKIDQRASLAYLIKAFSHFYEGRATRTLAWKPGAGEEFPQLPDASDDQNQQ